MPTKTVKRNARLIWLISDIRTKGYWTSLVNGIFFGARIQVVSVRAGQSTLKTGVVFLSDVNIPADTTVPIYTASTNEFYQSIAASLDKVRAKPCIYWIRDCGMICTSRKTALNLKLLEDDDQYLIDSHTLEEDEELLQLYAVS